jgi:hypothetical protein
MTSHSDSPTAETVPMPAETLEALKGSIAKWEKIVAGTGSNQGPYNCPLCEKFNECVTEEAHFAQPTCEGCPVQKAVGQAGCRGTPYERYEEAEESQIDFTEEDMRHLARAELDFLKSLLPEQSP